LRLAFPGRPDRLWRRLVLAAVVRSGRLSFAARSGGSVANIAAAPQTPAMAIR
jgi:hypothetical protein